MIIKVYLSPDKKVVQTLSPAGTGANKFNGDVKSLVSSINRGVNYGYEVIKD
jgi:hypothetical protein